MTDSRPTLSVEARTDLTQARAMSDVNVLEHTPVARVTPTGVRTGDGRGTTADCVGWAASLAVPTLAQDSGLEVDRSGRLIVDEYMQTPGDPDILGAGDGSFVDGRSPEPFGLAYLVLAMSLGPGDGFVQQTRFDDVSSGTVLTGKLAAVSNEWNNRYARSMLAWERTRVGTYRWARPPRSSRRIETVRCHGGAGRPSGDL